VRPKPRSLRNGETKVQLTICPASMNGQATSPTRRMFSAVLALEPGRRRAMADLPGDTVPLAMRPA
jgi:hypothetical protein